MIRKGYAFLNKKLENKMVPELIKIFLQYYELNCTNKTKLYPNIMEILVFLKKKNLKYAFVQIKNNFWQKK